ncbi:MAG: hypothetical protein ABI135_05390 [Rhodoferax sp.]
MNKTQKTKEPYPTSFDGYLRYAIHTDFAYFGGSKDKTLILLVRFKDRVAAAKLLLALKDLKLTFNLGPRSFGRRSAMPTRFLTIRGRVGIVGEKTWPAWKEFTDYVELSMPIQANTGFSITRKIDKNRPKSRAKTVLAIIDDGCAFAHERFRVASTGTNSRVFAIWDQNASALQPQVGAKHFGAKLSDFTVGIEYRRAPPDPNELGIDDWIALHKTPTGSVNEEACYREAGFYSLQYGVAHGVHVTDVLAGSVPPSSRLSYDPTNPPSFATAIDDAGKGTTDIIFVQIPQEAVDDASGRWLSAQVNEAMHYILSCLDPTVTKNLVVNLSYGPTTEPHDGNGNLEISLSEFTAYYDGAANQPKLDIVLPVGNSRLTESHFVFTSTKVGDTKTWTWRAPPDNPVPIFVELWVPRACANAISGWLYSPSPIPAGHQKPVIMVTNGSPRSFCWVIILPPTQPSPSADPPGPHGDWRIELTFAQAGVELDAYVARSDPNMNARVAAKQSRFIDTDWELKNGGFSGQTLKDGVCDTTGSCVVRQGTLSGIATATDPQILVAAGYRLSDGVSSRYSSLGPSREAARQGPDYALPTDESPAHFGIRAAGTLSGCTFRLIGTSTASPQLARRLLGNTPPVACSPSGQAPDTGCSMLLAP